MTKKTIFHLARHGQTQWNIEQRIQGQMDSELTPQGQQQAVRLGKLCQPLAITQILTSKLGRAVQTAQICAQQLRLNVTPLAGIEERNFGLWEGRVSTEMESHQDYVEITSCVSDCLPEQGESAKQLLSRFEKALIAQFQRAPNDNYLIITHGDVIRCFMTQFAPKGQASTGYDYKNGQLVSIVYEHENGVFSRL